MNDSPRAWPGFRKARVTAYALGAVSSFAWTFFLIAFLIAEFHTFNRHQRALFVSLTILDGCTAVTLYMMIATQFRFWWVDMYRVTIMFCLHAGLLVGINMMFGAIKTCSAFGNTDSCKLAWSIILIGLWGIPSLLFAFAGGLAVSALFNTDPIQLTLPQSITPPRIMVNEKHMSVNSTTGLAKNPFSDGRVSSSRSSSPSPSNKSRKSRPPSPLEIRKRETVTRFLAAGNSPTVQRPKLVMLPPLSPGGTSQIQPPSPSLLHSPSMLRANAPSPFSSPGSTPYSSRSTSPYESRSPSPLTPLSTRSPSPWTADAVIMSPKRTSSLPRMASRTASPPIERKTQYFTADQILSGGAKPTTPPVPPIPSGRKDIAAVRFMSRHISIGEDRRATGISAFSHISEESSAFGSDFEDCQSWPDMPPMPKMVEGHNTPKQHPAAASFHSEEASVHRLTSLSSYHHHDHLSFQTPPVPAMPSASLRKRNPDFGSGTLSPTPETDSLASSSDSDADSDVQLVTIRHSRTGSKGPALSLHREPTDSKPWKDRVISKAEKAARKVKPELDGYF